MAKAKKRKFNAGAFVREIALANRSRQPLLATRAIVKSCAKLALISKPLSAANNTAAD